MRRKREDGPKAQEVHENPVTGKRAVVPVELEISLTKYP
jgi:hypothetical protein